MIKKVAVLFSGGLDSTYLVWKNLKDGNEVQPIYIEINNNINKSILEKNRIKLLYNEFDSEFNCNDYSKRKIHPINYAVIVGVNANENSLSFKQVPVWIFGMTFLQSLDVDEIQIGYVMNDDAISYLDDIKNIYNSYQPICDKMIKLVFPITKKKKWEMARELPKKYLNLTVSCENPLINDKSEKLNILTLNDDVMVEYEPCCNCAQCKTVISTNYYELGNLPEIYDKYVRESKIMNMYDYGYKVITPNGIEYYESLSIKAKPEPYQLEIPFDDYDGIENNIIKLYQNSHNDIKVASK